MGESGIQDFPQLRPLGDGGMLNQGGWMYRPSYQQSLSPAEIPVTERQRSGFHTGVAHGSLGLTLHDRTIQVLGGLRSVADPTALACRH